MEKLVIPNPKWLEAQNSGRSTWGINKFITNFFVMPNEDFIVPRGLFSWITKFCKDFEIPYTIRDDRTIFDHIDIDSSKIVFRPYQLDGVSRLIANSSGVLVSPAGSGKTIMGLSLLPMLGQPTLWLTHTGPLATQAKERAEFFLPNIGEIGLIGDSKWKIGDVLTIGMVQTLVRRMEEASKIQDRFGMLIVDESHRVPSRTFSEVTGIFNPYYTYGLTATPYRRDRLEALMFHALGEDKVVVDIKSVKEHGGIIVPTIRYREIRSKEVDGNDIQKILRDNIVNNTKRNRIIVGDVVREAAEGHFCIVISDRKEHCEMLFDLISKSWEKTGIATGDYTKKQVQEEIDRLNRREVTVLVATSALLGEGFDAAFLDRGFLAMPFRAEAKTEQFVGRIQRSAPEKEDAILYDYVDVNIGVLKNQFYSKSKDCRYRIYTKLGAYVEPY